MRNFSIDLVWAKVQTAAAAIGGYLGYFVGGVDGLMTALIIFMVIDYITGLMCAIANKKLSSEVGFKGICRKVLIIMLVGVAHNVDLHVVGTGQALRSAVMSEFSFCIFGACAAKRGKLELSDRDRRAGSRRASHQDDQESYQASGDMGDQAKRRHKSTRVANNRGKMRRK